MMYFYRERKQTSVFDYPLADFIYHTNDTSYIGMEKELTTEEVDRRDYCELGRMSREEFGQRYGI